MHDERRARDLTRRSMGDEVPGAAGSGGQTASASLPSAPARP